MYELAGKMHEKKAGSAGRVCWPETDNPRATTVPQRALRIPEEMEALKRELAVQAEMIDILGARLQPAMSLPELEGNKECVPSEPTCPLAAEIQAARRRLAGNTEALRDLLSRLEV